MDMIFFFSWCHIVKLSQSVLVFFEHTISCHYKTSLSFLYSLHLYLTLMNLGVKQQKQDKNWLVWFILSLCTEVSDFGSHSYMVLFIFFFTNCHLNLLLIRLVHLPEVPVQWDLSALHSMALLPLHPQNSKVHILDTEGFETTFGPKSQRKRPSLTVGDVKDLLEQAEASAQSYNADKDKDLVTEDTGVR